MKLRTKKPQTLFNIEDVEGKINSMWDVEYIDHTYNPKKDIVTIRVRANEVGAKFGHWREFDVSAQGTNFRKDAIPNYMKTELGSNFEEVQ